MSFELLTDSQESLLKEILDHRDKNGNGNITYWNNKFENLSDSEDVRIRSIFKYLKDNEYISTSWAGDALYNLNLLNEGLTYFDNKKNYKVRQKKLSNKEWKIAIISGVIVAIITTILNNLPSIIKWIGELFNAN